MKMIFGTRIKNILYTLAVFTLILVTAAFAVTSVYAANNNNPLTITVRQTFTSSSATVYSTFTYRLESLSAGAPMPAGEFTPSETPIPAGTPIPGPSDTPIPTGTPIPGPAEAPMPAGDVADGYTFTVTGNSSVQIGPIYYSIQGTYQYRLSQIVGSGSYYTYDRRKYDIRVQVDELLDVSVVAFNEDEEKVEEILFENRYYYNGGSGGGNGSGGGGNRPTPTPTLMPTPTPGVLSVAENLSVIKIVNGYPGNNSNEQFSFRLVAKDAAHPMPAGSVNGTKTIGIIGTGEGSFGAMNYNKAGIYTYTVNEENTRRREFTYDTIVYTVTITVAASGKDGQLTVSRAVTDNRRNAATALVFINTYNPDANATPTPSAPPGSTDSTGGPDGPSGGLGISGGGDLTDLADSGEPTDFGEAEAEAIPDPNASIGDRGAPIGILNMGTGTFPKTGDDSHLELFIITGLLASVLLFLVIKRKPKQLAHSRRQLQTPIITGPNYRRQLQTPITGSSHRRQ